MYNNDVYEVYVSNGMYAMEQMFFSTKEDAENYIEEHYSTREKAMEHAKNNELYTEDVDYEDWYITIRH